MDIINWRIIGNPLNWLIVVVMLLIVSFAIDALLRRVDSEA